MKILQKRRLSAWVLLSVFVPMLALSLVHHHESVSSEDVECMDCAHQVRHSGHFSVGSVSVDNCLICQLVSLPYVKATDMVLRLSQPKSETAVKAVVQPLQRVALAYLSPRAPPLGCWTQESSLF